MRTSAALRQDLPEVAPPLWKRRGVRTGVIVAVTLLAAYGLIYRDVVSRAKESYLQGEQHMAWFRNPAAKQKFFADRLASDKAALEAERASGKITDLEFRRRADTLQFDHDFALTESSVKYAYQWYKDTYEMFSPPESKWVTMAREKAPEALELWKAELRARRVPFEESTFE